MYDSHSHKSPWFDKSAAGWRRRKRFKEEGGGALYSLIAKDAWEALETGAREMGTRRAAIEFALMNTFGPQADPWK